MFRCKAMFRSSLCHLMTTLRCLLFVYSAKIGKFPITTKSFGNNLLNKNFIRRTSMYNLIRSERNFDYSKSNSDYSERNEKESGAQGV